MALINEGDVAALNSGTTNTVLLQELVGLNLRVTVGTNNYAVLSALMQNPAIRLIAVGGSIMDVGKSLYRLYGKALPDADALRRLIEGKGYGRPSARWSGVPATAGTGSEVTCWTSIWDPEKNAKCLAVPAPVWVLLMLWYAWVWDRRLAWQTCASTPPAFFTKSFAQSFESIPDETIGALEVAGAHLCQRGAARSSVPDCGLGRNVSGDQLLRARHSGYGRHRRCGLCHLQQPSGL